MSASQPAPLSSPQDSAIGPRSALSVPLELGPQPARTNDLDEHDLLSGQGDALDISLESIGRAAQVLTGAAGAAIALSTDGQMICRARCGDISPSLGARVSPDSGISGACLRTGKVQHCSDTDTDDRVDAEVCRQLGLRSIAVVPIHTQEDITGIIEVFSDRSYAFTEEHIALLQRFAALVQRTSSSPDSIALPIPKPPLEIAEQTSTTPLPKPSARFRLPVLLAQISRKSLWVGGSCLAGLALMGTAIWLGWHTPDANLAPQAVSSSTETSDKAGIASPRPEMGLGVDPPGKPSAGRAVKLAASLDVLSRRDTRPGTSASDPSPEIVVRREMPTPRPVETIAPEPPLVVSAAPNASALRGILATSTSMPGLASLPVSQGVSKGRLLRRVMPVYPPSALAARISGKVVLEAHINEDGTVRDAKAVEGPVVLTQAALDAVKQWRYQPYQLNGQPVGINTTIVVNFVLP